MMTQIPDSQQPLYYSPQPEPLQPPPPPQIPAKKSVWPTAIGMISIVLGGLGVLGNFINMINFAVNPILREVFGKMPPRFMAFMNISILVGLIQCVILLWAGISLAKRRPAGRPLHIVYAIITIITCIASTAIMIPLLSEMTQSVDRTIESELHIDEPEFIHGESWDIPEDIDIDDMPEDVDIPDLPIEMHSVTYSTHEDTQASQSRTMLQSMRSFMIFGSIIGLILGLAYPIFLLIWMMREPVKREIESWRQNPAAANQRY